MRKPRIEKEQKQQPAKFTGGRKTSQTLRANCRNLAPPTSATKLLEPGTAATPRARHSPQQNLSPAEARTAIALESPPSVRRRPREELASLRSPAPALLKRASESL